jgi:hypothetical protein
MELLSLESGVGTASHSVSKLSVVAFWVSCTFLLQG